VKESKHNKERKKNIENKEAKQKTNKKKQLTILYAILGVCIAGILTFGIWLAMELYLDWQSQNYYTQLANSIEMRPRPSPARPEAQTSVAEEKPEKIEELWLPFVDFEELNKRFSGVKGWISLEGTPLNYPIMQTDNNDYFLNHLPDGTRHRSGSIFLDYRNSPDFTDRNTIIYGHMSRTDDMFGVLRHFREQAYFDANKIMYIHLPDRDYQLEIFTVYLVDSGVLAEIPVLEFRDDEHFMQNLNHIRSISLVSSDLEVTAQDRIVTLATCVYDFVNARLVLVGKLVPFIEPVQKMQMDTTAQEG